MRNITSTLLIGAVFMTTGCTSMLSIGESEFSCSAPDRAGYRCKSAREVYELTHPNARNHKNRQETSAAVGVTGHEDLERKKGGWFKGLMGKLKPGKKETGDEAVMVARGESTVVKQDMMLIRSDPTHLHQDQVPHIDYGVRPFSRTHEKNFYGNREEMFEVIPSTSQSMIPIRTPPKVMRVMIASYETIDGILHSGGYSFVEIEERRWQIGTPARDRNSGHVRSMEQVLNDNAKTIDKPASTGVEVGPTDIDNAQRRFPPAEAPLRDTRNDGLPNIERLTDEEIRQRQLEYYLRRQQEQESN